MLFNCHVVASRSFRAAVLGGLVLSGLGCGDSAKKLRPEASLIQALKADQIDRRTVDLEVSELLSLEVVQLGIDVSVALDDPAGHRLVTVDGLLGAVGTERLLWEAKEPGTYTIEITGSRQLPSSRYDFLLDEPRPASALDRSRVEAARAFFDAYASVAAGRLWEATPRFLQARELWAALDDEVWLAEIDHALGFLAEEGGDLRGAIEYFQRVLDSTAGAAIKVKSRHNVARLHLLLHELEPAWLVYLEALKGWEELEDKYSQAIALHDLGFICRRLGEIPEALSYYDQALELLDELDNRSHYARTLHNRARAQAERGRTEDALRDFRDVLAIREDLGEERGVAVTLTGIGQVFKNRGELDAAMEHFERALQLQESVVSDSYDRAVTLVGIGEIHFQRNRVAEAEDLFREALEIFGELDRLREQGYVLRMLGRVEEAANPQQAAELYGESLRISREVCDRDEEAASLLGLARAERLRDVPQLARQHAESALSIIEDLRRQAGPSIELRSAYFATKQNYYDFYIDLLMELDRLQPAGGYSEQALAASERARARSQLDSLVAAGSEPGVASDPLIGHKRELQRTIESKQFQLTEMLAHGAPSEATDAVKGELREHVAKLGKLREQIRRSRPLYAQLTDPRPLSADEIRRSILDGETLLLEYQLAESRSFLWSVTSEDVKSFELPSQESIEELAGTAAKLLSVSDQQQYRADLDWALSELSEILLRPVEDQLAGKSRILIVAEGALQYVPFAVLPSPTAAKSDSAPLISSHEIINLPSASVLHALREQFDRRPAPIRDVAVFADPVFDLDDGRSETYQPATRSEGEGPDQIPERLYFTGLEAEAIMQLAAGGENLQALRFDATKEALINPELSDYRYVHIATHGHLDSELPELSSLLFSRYDPEGRELDGRVRLHEIYQLELRAELVVLSACRTAHGRDVRGEGIVGWTQGFMYSGAKRVLVSLWNVEDEATAELMRHFYRFLLVERLSPAASLRRAQDAIRQMPQWRMPYHWAGFVLSGEFL